MRFPAWSWAATESVWRPCDRGICGRDPGCVRMPSSCIVSWAGAVSLTSTSRRGVLECTTLGSPIVTAGAVASTLTSAVTLRWFPAASVAVTTSGMAPSETLSESAKAPSAPATAWAVAASAAAVTRTPGWVWPESARVSSRTQPVGSAPIRSGGAWVSTVKAHERSRPPANIPSPAALTDTVCRPSARRMPPSRIAPPVRELEVVTSRPSTRSV